MPHVLLVEDEIAFREDIADYLRLQSLEVDEVGNGADALEHLRTKPYDVVLCDILMPGMDGYHVLQHQRQLEKTGHAPSAIPFVFLTALSDVHDQTMARELGCDDFLSKPVDFKLLMATVRARIEKAEQQRMHQEWMQLQTLSALQTVYAQELLQPTMQIVEAMNYLESCSSSGNSHEALLKAAPHIKTLARTQLESIDMLRATEKISRSAPPDVFMPTQWLEDVQRNLKHALPELSVQTAWQCTHAHRVMMQPANVLKAVYFLVRAAYQMQYLRAVQLRMVDDAARLHLQLWITDADMNLAELHLVSLLECVTQPAMHSDLHGYWGALHFADTLMRAHGGEFRLAVHDRALALLHFTMPAVIAH